MNRAQTNTITQNFWLWVGKPDSFYDEAGRPSEIPEPFGRRQLDGWHTCHMDTKRGDLALRWTTHPLKQIGYLLQAKSDAYDLSPISRARKMAWRYGCDFRSVFKFENPLTMAEIRNDSYLEDWSALRANFQGSVFKIPPNVWRRVNRHLSKGNLGYEKSLATVQDRLSKAIILEEQLEERLAGNLRILRRLGFDLSLYHDDKTSVGGRQMVCYGQGGRIDLLCYEAKKRRYVVIELKNVMATRETFGQISSYMGWVKRHIAKRKKVIGVVISRGYDLGFRDCLHGIRNIQQLDLAILGFH